MGVDVLSAQQEFLESFLAYSDRERQPDRRLDRTASANPIQKTEYPGLTDHDQGFHASRPGGAPSGAGPNHGPLQAAHGLPLASSPVLATGCPALGAMRAGQAEDRHRL